MRDNALSVSRRLRFVTLAVLYAAQGIPDAMVLIVFPAYLAGKGLPPEQIGMFLAVAMLPNAAKLLLGPIVDRWAWLAMGRRKPWIMAGQTGIALSFLSLAMLDDPAAELGLFTLGAFLITLSTALQDVATDATAMDLIPATEQGRANGVMWGAKTIGTAVFATAGSSILYLWGFNAMVSAAAAVLVLAFAFLCCIRERPGEKLLPWSSGTAEATATTMPSQRSREILLALWRELRGAGARRLVGLSLAIGITVGLSGALAPVMMIQHHGWDEAGYSQFRAAMKLAAGVSGMVMGGWLVDRHGPRMMIATTLGGIAAINLLLSAFDAAAFATAYLVAYEFLIVFAFVTFFAATMRQVSPAIAATQFSFTMVCGNLTMSLGARLLGPLTALGGITAVGLGIAIAAALGAVVYASGRPALRRT